MLARYFDNAPGYYSLSAFINRVFYKDCYDGEINDITDISNFTSADLTTCKQHELDVIYSCKHIRAADIASNISITPQLCKFIRQLECLQISVDNNVSDEQMISAWWHQGDLSNLTTLLISIASECNRYEEIMGAINHFVSRHHLELVSIQTDKSTKQLCTTISSCKYLGITQSWNDPPHRIDLFDRALVQSGVCSDIKLLSLSIQHDADTDAVCALLSNQKLRYVHIIANTMDTKILDALFANTKITNIFLSGFANACEYIVANIDKLYARRIEVDMMTARYCPLDSKFGEKILTNLQLQRCKFLNDQWAQCTYAKTALSRNITISSLNVHKVVINTMIGFLRVITIYDIEIYPVAIICTYLNAHYHLVDFNSIYKLVYNVIMSYRKIIQSRTVSASNQIH